MKVVLLPSSAGAEPHQYLTTFLVDDHLAVDAGSLGFFGTPDQQGRVRDVLLSHSHLDHIASLPIFLENVYRPDGPALTIHAGPEALDCLQRDIFNNRVWPDFLRLRTHSGPFLRLEELQEGRSLSLGNLRVTPVAVDHSIPTFGFLIERAGSAIVLAGDTGPTRRIWELANAHPDLKAVFLEVTFPDELTHLADLSCHLTPASFAIEIGKIKPGTRLLANHIKPRYYSDVVRQLDALGIEGLAVARPSLAIEF